jgi:hypothetical protein
MFSALSAGGATASGFVIEHLSTSSQFADLSNFEGDGIKTRDAEDGDMLQTGIEASLASGALQPLPNPRTYLECLVDGKSPSEVSQTISTDMATKTSPASEGKVVVIVGLSGVGKGTTVDILKEQLVASRENDSSKVQTWSNGNIFRSLTLLTSLYMEKNGLVESTRIEEVLTPERKLEFMSYLSFEKTEAGVFDTKIKAFDLGDQWVGDIQNTTLKGPLVNGKIPSVAKLTQGEVIGFARGAIAKLSKEGGIDVIVEGRSQTLDYIDSEMRYELALTDDSVVGKRRAAQLVVGAATKVLKVGLTDDETQRVIAQILPTLS